MILDTTHTNKDHNKLIDDLVGKSFGLVNAIKMGGVGSKRMIVEAVSPNMQQYLNKVDDVNYANLELRPNGVLIRINKGLKNFTWVIPYYQLVIYKTNGSSIHAQGKFIHFKQNTTFKENKAFFDKLLDAKVKYHSQYDVLP
ncbi:hypothetical protein BXY82_1869 [Gelidibacter sediminis]|uniref:Uncharacterized protein n=1 Tax=Gelidibacter sediminis TaxID=1608710 RepID=A0A4V3F8C7_9FLAO|nr:hypothetical protein [Gelidibacter sediminis]TDU39836.1 hypothetical protein BXY82_1869 [Gelidibacter sediminis]